MVLERLQRLFHGGASSSSSTSATPSSLPADYGAAAPLPQPRPHSDAPFDARAEGVELARRTFRTFYSHEHRQWCSPYNEAGTIDARHGYTVWPVSIGVWALANAAKRSRRAPADVAALQEAFFGMEKHWHPDERGYCAWVYFPGNADTYYDDNAHCGNALVTAFEATGDRRYLARATDVVTGILRKGWDRDGAGPGAGGVAWHMGDDQTRNACSTLSAAVLAARLALLKAETAYCTDMARRCVEFAERHLIDAQDGLVLDSWHADGEGKPWTHDARKFTYNTGFGIHAYALLARLTGDTAYLQRGIAMARAATDPAGALMDQTLVDPHARMWWDCVFFAQHLADGLGVLRQVLAAQAAHEAAAAEEAGAFVRHVGGWCRDFTVDARDGLAFRQLRPWLVDQERTDLFNAQFGMQLSPEPDAGEREVGEGAVEGRRLIKTVIACAAVANVLMYAGDCASQPAV